MKIRWALMGTLALGLVAVPAVAGAQSEYPGSQQQQQGSQHGMTGTEKSAGQAGQVGQSAQATTFDALPANAKDAISKELKGGTVDKVEKTTSGDKTIYEAFITQPGNKKLVVRVDESGKVLSSHPATKEKGETKTK